MYLSQLQALYPAPTADWTWPNELEPKYDGVSSRIIELFEGIDSFEPPTLPSICS